MRSSRINNGVLDLEFLGLGQRVSINLPPHADVKETIETMKARFSEVEPGSLPVGVHFDATRQWLIGMKFKALDFLRFSAVFEDPRLYGLLIQLGSGAGQWKNLALDITYQKVNNTTGLYRGVLTLPDDFRRVDMGTCMLTLPIIGVDIYTNGDFKVDLGFPAGLDFSRSFQLEAFPYKGAGGFYFGKSGSGVLADTEFSDCAPIKTVTEFGLGLELGIGKSFEKGILRAGVSATIQGLLEGALAKGDGGECYRVRGIVGVAGELYGEVDLTILSAAVKAAIQAKAEGILESAGPRPLNFTVDVSASGEIQIGFGKFKKTISKSFNKSVEFDYELGKRKRTSLLALPANDMQVELGWNPLFPSGDKKSLKLYFTPQLTVGDSESGRVAKYTAMTYIDCPVDPSESSHMASVETSFKRLLIGIFLWTMQAYKSPSQSLGNEEEVKSQNIGSKDLADILATLKNDAKKRFTYRDSISCFLEHYFQIELCHFDAENKDTANAIPSLAFFSMLPDFNMVVKQHHAAAPGGITKLRNVQFSSHGRTYSAANLDNIKKIVNRYSVKYRNEVELEYDRSTQKSFALQDVSSMATACIIDCFLMMVNEMLHEGIEIIGKPTDSKNPEMNIGILVGEDNLFSHERVQRLSSMVSRFMLFGLRPPKEDRPDAPLVPLYELTGQQFDVPNIQNGDTLTITLSNTGTIPIVFIDCKSGKPTGNNQMTITLTSSDMNSIRAILSVEIPETELKDVGELPPYKIETPKYPAKVPLEWNDSRLWLFTDSLSRKLEMEDDTSGYRLKKPVQQGSSTCFIEMEEHEYSLVTKIDVRVRPVQVRKTSSLRSGAPFLYEIIGTDHEGQQHLKLLEQALRNNLVPDMPKIHILYSVKNKNKLISTTTAQIDVIQTNVSTYSTHGTPFASNIGSMVKKLLQASIIGTGEGTYLYYCDEGKGLDEIFKTDQSTSPVPNPVSPAEARITVLVVHPKGTTPKAFTNGAVTDVSLDGIFYEDEDTQIKVPAHRPGHIGFWIERDIPTYNYSDDANISVYLKQQYQMVGYTVEDNKYFIQQPASPIPLSPLGERKKDCLPAPASQEPINKWRYETVIPYADFTEPSERSVPWRNDQKDPYAGVGRQLKLSLQLRDVTGNILTNPKRIKLLDLYYTDRLIPVHQWPGTQVDYIVVAACSTGQPEFQVRFVFDPEKYRDKCAQHVKLAKLTYSQVYWQIVRDEVDVCITNSFQPNESITVDKLEVIRYLKEILRLLESGDSGSERDRPFMCVPIPAQLTNSETIFELHFEVSIIRNSGVHPHMKDVPDVQRVTSTILPCALQASSSEPGWRGLDQTLKEMALLFREALSLELAIGSSSKKSDGQQSLWVVQWGNIENRFRVEIQEELFMFAPAPLSTSIHNFTFPITPYSENDPTGSGQREDISFTNVDLQVWAKECLSFIDEMLSTQFVNAVHQAGAGSELDLILDAKCTIANAISNSIIHLGRLCDDKGEGSILEAKKRIEQQLLVKLSDAFNIDAVVQHRVISHGPINLQSDIDLVPRFYGEIQGDGVIIDENKNNNEKNNEKEQAFSSFKLPLAPGEGYLTSLFRTTVDGKQKGYSFDEIHYNISHLEHQIQNLPEMGDYQDSSWLQFVNPICIKSKRSDIPIVLKTHPKPLTFKEQRIEYNPIQANTLKEARKYSYKFTYLTAEPLEAQDRIKSEINWGGYAVGLADGIYPLAHALAQLRYAYLGGLDKEGQPLNNGIKSHMERLIQESTLPCPKYSSYQPVSIFQTYVKALAAAWCDWSNVINKRFRPVPGSIKSFIEIVEYKETNTKDAALCVRLEVKHPVELKHLQLTQMVEIPGYTTEPIDGNTFKFYKGTSRKKYLTYEKAKITHFERNIIVEGLDILHIATAWAEIYQTRNEYLFENISSNVYDAINERFIFRSLPVRFANSITPNLISEKRFNISEITQGTNIMKKTVKGHLHSLLDYLLEDQDRIQIKGSVSYHHKLTEDGRCMVKVPYANTFPFRTEDKNIVVEELGKIVENLLRKKDGPKKDQGEFRIDLSLFDPHKEERPILQLKGLFLENQQIDLP
ncbi:hypothetical protein COE08_21615 [Priestia megaterium]|uniref:hypothetical protein n=1 Tax=Priestia megaterium TaxID=1404 RepID=UPI000BFBB5B0|nr:hypothetical protein [Priestia megaterium]PGX17478.1 hypothetical protein COE08_21615 [Priestia megaterium]